MADGPQRAEKMENTEEVHGWSGGYAVSVQRVLPQGEIMWPWREQSKTDFYWKASSLHFAQKTLYCFSPHWQVAWTFTWKRFVSFFQHFVRHFYVLVPRGISSTKSGIREFFRRIHLPPAGYQVGNTMVHTPQTRLCFSNINFWIFGVFCWTSASISGSLWRRCSCGRRSVSVCRRSSTRKYCGGLSRCSGASEPFWSGGTSSACDELPASSR